MSYFVTKYPAGTFSWSDVYSKDITQTKHFLSELFGWTSEDMPTGEGRPDYTMFYLDGKAVAGGSPNFEDNMPSFWANYVTVSSVDETAEEAKKLGGTVRMEPMDVLDAGRMAEIVDPTGASLLIWEPKKHIGAQVVNKVGAMCWNELYTNDVEAAKVFYSKLFGWSFEVSPEMGNYITIKNTGRINGGVMEITSEIMGMPPCWMVYYTVGNIEESLAKVKELGGTIAMPTKDISVGKIAVTADPAGAHFIIMEMSVTPDEWVE